MAVVVCLLLRDKSDKNFIPFMGLCDHLLLLLPLKYYKIHDTYS